PSTPPHRRPSLLSEGRTIAQMLLHTHTHTHKLNQHTPDVPDTTTHTPADKHTHTHAHTHTDTDSDECVPLESLKMFMSTVGGMLRCVCACVHTHTHTHTYTHTHTHACARGPSLSTCCVPDVCLFHTISACPFFMR